MSRRGRTLSWCSTAPAGTRPKTCAGPTKSRRCRCRPTAPRSIPKSGSGRSCGSIPWPYAAFLTTPPCSTPARMPGAASSARPAASTPFAPVPGPSSHEFSEAVLGPGGEHQGTHPGLEDLEVAAVELAHPPEAGANELVLDLDQLAPAGR